MRPEPYDIMMDTKAKEFLCTIQNKIDEAYETGGKDGFDRGLHKSFEQSQDELANLIWDALMELAHRICPYCQRGIAMEDHLTEENIKQWLEERK